VTERSEGTNRRSTIGRGGAERQRGAAVAERSEGTNRRSTIGRGGAERQRGAAVTERSEGTMSAAPPVAAEPSASEAES